VQRVAVAALVVVLMLSIGLRTDPADFRAALRRPRALGFGLVANLLWVPLGVWALTAALGVPAWMRAGFVLCAACPGGPSGPLFASRARGDLALATTATLSLSGLGVLTAPPTLSLLLGVSVALPLRAMVAPMMATLALLQLLPLGLGMVVRRARPGFAARWAGPAETTANTLLLLVIVALLATRWRVLGEVGVRGLAVAAVAVLASLAVGALVPGDGPARRSLALVTAVRGLSLALFVSATWVHDAQVDAAILAYALCTMLLPFAVATALRR